MSLNSCLSFKLLCNYCRKLQEELFLREQMFQEYKEGSEREILSLKQIIRDLKQRLEGMDNNNRM